MKLLALLLLFGTSTAFASKGCTPKNSLFNEKIAIAQYCKTTGDSWYHKDFIPAEWTYEGTLWCIDKNGEEIDKYYLGFICNENGDVGLGSLRLMKDLTERGFTLVGVEKSNSGDHMFFKRN